MVARLEAALRLAGDLPAAETCSAPRTWSGELGEGWVAEEALAVALYAVLATAPEPTRRLTGRDPEAHFRAAHRPSPVNHSGDSDSTASIAGNILGTFYGEAVPAGGVARGAGGAGGHPGHGRRSWPPSPAPDPAHGRGRRRPVLRLLPAL